MTCRRHLRTRNSADHIAAVRERRLLSFEEAAIIAGITRTELKRRIAPDDRPFFRVGRRLYVRPAELREFLQTQRAARA